MKNGRVAVNELCPTSPKEQGNSKTVQAGTCQSPRQLGSEGHGGPRQRPEIESITSCHGTSACIINVNVNLCNSTAVSAIRVNY